MKIIISNYDDIKNPYYAGGGAYMLHEIAKRLSKKHKVTIICGSYKRSFDEVVDNVVYRHIGIKAGGPFLGQAAFSLLLPLFAVKESYDVWIENFVPPHSTNFVPLFTKKPVIGITSILEAREFSRKYKLPFYVIENIGIKQYKNIIALSNAMEKRVKKNNPNANVKTILAGVDNSLLKLKTTEGKYVLYLGRIDIYQKGLDILVEAWKKLALKNNVIRLVIAGNGAKNEEEQLKNMIKRNNMEDSIELTGKVGGKKKEDLLANCLFAVVPSRFESFGIVALEVLAVGKALICFDIDGFSWIPKNLCKKIKNLNSDAFAEAISDLIQKRSLRKKLSDNGRIFAKEFNWDSVAEKYEEFIGKVVLNKN
jgi:glycosyltransferase involved in cell wall biosynthesis